MGFSPKGMGLLKSRAPICTPEGGQRGGGATQPLASESCFASELAMFEMERTPFQRHEMAVAASTLPDILVTGTLPLAFVAIPPEQSASTLR